MDTGASLAPDSLRERSRCSYHSTTRVLPQFLTKRRMLMSQSGKRSIGMGVLAALLLFIAALFLPFGTPSAPQNPIQAHPDVPSNIIDGSKTPEQIPDEEAYKLLFLSISLTPDKLNDQEAVTRRMTFVTQTGVSPEEIPQV